MKRMSVLMALLFVGSVFFSFSASAMERKVEKKVNPGVVKAWRLGNSNYCHLRFPPIRRSTLFTPKPMLADPEFVRLIDYYGPCDHDPLGEVEVEKQQRIFDESFRIE